MGEDLVKERIMMEVKGEAKRFFSYTIDTIDFFIVALPEMVNKNLDAGELWVRFQPGKLFNAIKGEIYKDGEWNE